MLVPFLRHLKIWFKGDPDGYQKWILENDLRSKAELQWIRDRIEQLPQKPKFSILLPVGRPSIRFLRHAIESVLIQIYPHWELCIAVDASTDAAILKLLRNYVRHDSRVKLSHHAQNGSFSAASNAALELATNEWTVFFNQDGELPEHALYCVAEEINEHPDAKLIYTDEDKVSARGDRSKPFFKPDWNPALLTAQNYFGHLGIFRADLIRAVDGFREGYEGAQDYDLLWRCVEKVKSTQIRHVPRVLYHGRSLPDREGIGVETKRDALLAERRVLEDHLRREGIDARVEPCAENSRMHRVVYHVPTPVPSVTVLIPMRDKVHLAQTCVETLTTITQYDNYETVIINNDSREESTQLWLREFSAQARCRVIDVPGKFSYSRINNEAVRKSSGEILLFLNNDIEILHDAWMTEMVGQLLQLNVAAVGARLWYPDRTLQHAGIIVGLGGLAGHHFCHSDEGRDRAFGRDVVCQNFSAVTAACMAVKRDVFEQVGGFDEENLPIQYNDLDLCLRLREAGYDIVWTPYAELIHHESKSRGYNVTPEQMEVWEREKNYIRKRWANWIEHDPAYNPNLSVDRSDFSIAKVPRISLPWRIINRKC